MPILSGAIGFIFHYKKIIILTGLPISVILNKAFNGIIFLLPFHLFFFFFCCMQQPIPEYTIPKYRPSVQTSKTDRAIQDSA